MQFTEEQLANEEWRPAVGWEDTYEVSSLGRVRSVPRTIVTNSGIKKNLDGRYLSLKPNNLGYVCVPLSRDERKATVKVHHLVAEAFIPNRDSLPEIDHVNGVRNDNRVSNLRWTSRKGNCKNRVFDSSRPTVKPYVAPQVDLDDLPGEEWRDIENYEGMYQISNFGRVKSLPRSRVRGRILKLGRGTNGYAIVHLCKKCVQETLSVHRLVAKAFIPNPDNLPEVNHLDECKTNNAVSNLRWVTREENENYGTKRERGARSHDYTKSSVKSAANHDYAAIGMKRRKPVLQFDLEGNLIRCWSGICEIKDTLGFCSSAISSACNRVGDYKRGISYGYRWCFEEDYGCVA